MVDEDELPLSSGSSNFVFEDRTLPMEIPDASTESDGNNSWDVEDRLFTCTSLPSRRFENFRRADSDQISLLSSSMSSKMELEITSRSVSRWRRSLSAKGQNYQPWDFSEVSSAVDNTAVKLSEGKIRADPPSRTGVSGTYFFRSVDSSMNVLGVFKPVDEEVCLRDEDAVEENRGSSSLLKYIRHAFHSGEGAYKEQAAYLLDHGRFANIPQTTIAKCDITLDETGTKRTKTGAFQVYVENIGDADDYGPGVFSFEDVQRIGLFDIRVFNCDRHGGNILVCKKSGDKASKHNLVPIDHGYILPDSVVACPWPVWMDWPQARQPFSEEAKRYVDRLDGEHDANMIAQEFQSTLKKGSQLTLKIATLLLKKAVQANLTLFDIGSLVFTRDQRESTFMEKIGNEAYSIAFARQARQGDMDSIEIKPGAVACDIFSFANIKRETELFPETEAFVLKYMGRLIDDKLQSMTNRCLSLCRTRSTPDFAPVIRSMSSVPSVGEGERPEFRMLSPLPCPRLSPPSRDTPPQLLFER